MGLLHSFLLGENLLASIWLNLLTGQQTESNSQFLEGMGVAPWQQMPDGEDCAVARALKKSVMGRLIPLCRFCLLANHGLHYSEGIAHGGYKEGLADPSVAVNYSGKDPKALWVDPEKRPWRELTALLGFFEQNGSQGFQSWQLRAGLDRARDAAESFAIWSGGLRVSSNAGEQYASGSDDFVESLIWLRSSTLGAGWFTQLKAEMSALDDLGKHLYGRVMGYFKEQTVEGGKQSAQATHLFWQLCERDFQTLVDHCDSDEVSVAMRHQLRKKFAGYLHRAYDQFCPKETARQLDAWAKCRPNTHNYLKQEA